MPARPHCHPRQPHYIPNTSDTIGTQAYDAYQWYKDDLIIPGAISQYCVVSHLMDAGSYFSVDAALNGCTEMSPSVLVDGWAFLPVTVTTVGLLDTLCIGDTLLLIINLPYDILIQWTNNGISVPDAVNDTLIVTYSGNYSVSGAPSLCPGFIQPLGLTLSFQFINCTTGLPESQPVRPAVFPNPAGDRL